MPTILSELSQRNPDLNNSHLRSGTNTKSPGWPHIEHWVLWEDFNATQCYELFRNIVDTAWRDPTAGVELTSFDVEIFDEDSLEHSVLSRKLYPPVNAALVQAHQVLNMDESHEMNLGRGGRTYYNPSGEEGHRPDWALCSRSHMTNASAYRNLLPGDTKLSTKWRSSLYNDRNMFSRWVDPVRQILHYCGRSKVRYGYIITDTELVVFRCTWEAIGPSGMAGRSSRSQPFQGHYRDDSGDSEVSHLSETLQSALLSSSFEQTESGGEFRPIEYRAIPWSNHGDGKQQLTVRLGLFYLSLMAGYGPSAIQSEYPSFNSWHYRSDDVYMHNTTGMLSQKRPPGAVLQYFDPSVEGPRWVEMEETSYLTLASVRTLQIDEDDCYFYVDDGERVLITEDMLVYDEATKQFGSFYGLEWALQS